MPTLFDSFDLQGLQLKHRVAMAPLTRCRANAAGVPQPITQTYYAQRASAGLIITEATNVTSKSCAFERARGIYSNAQVEGWKPVIEAVHKNGGSIFMQLWHCGRVGSDAILDGRSPLSPSGVNDDLEALQVWGLMANGRYARIAATPSREMTKAEIAEATEDYGHAAANAIEAGADGVEVHAANGYLPHQFMTPTLNRRTDSYGGRLSNRLRFLNDIVDSVCANVPASRVGVRLSPYAAYNNTRDPDPDGTTKAVPSMLDKRGVAYLHLADTNAWEGKPDLPRFLAAAKPNFCRTLIANGGITPTDANELVGGGAVDLIAFGRSFSPIRICLHAFVMLARSMNRDTLVGTAA
jgi:2,4-dienoyl-CoA reductase-like NADH-dependent reductase (Old Yellow Enzyme family)